MDARDPVQGRHDRNADGEAHEAVAVHVWMPCMIRMIEEDGSILELLSELRDSCVVYTQEYRLATKFLRNDAERYLDIRAHDLLEIDIRMLILNHCRKLLFSK